MKTNQIKHSQTLKTLTLQSPAKINLRLEVLGKRADGYHDLKMVMCRISLFDEVTLTLNDDNNISVVCDNNSVPCEEENIAWKAASAFKKASGINNGIHIRIKKRIPMGGGLGGGSSNAATVLLGLNSLTGNTLSTEKLMKMGLTLGADVPFFIFKRPALAEGIGEKLSPISGLPELSLILVNPGVEISTASIFNSLNLGLTKPIETLSIAEFNCSLSEVLAILHNDLEDVTFNKYPKVKMVKEMLHHHGAAGVLMSGSGSTVFSLYLGHKKAETAFTRIKQEAASNGWFAFLAKSL